MSRKNLLLIKGQKGIALVTAMILALLAIAIAISAIYMILQSTEISGLKKHYATALGAANGATEGTALLISLQGAIPLDMSTITFINNPVCLDTKLTKRRTNWGSCDTGPVVTNTSYDIRFNFGNYTAYAKVVDTIPGNTLIGESLEVKGVVSGGSGIIKNPTAVPYMYRLEVRSESNTNTQESAEISALYAH
jgi:Tfp pilus assembly protein PilX